MSKPIIISSLFILSFLVSNGQVDSSMKNNFAGVFEKITQSLKEFKLDTTTPPDDKLTRKIVELKSLKGIFNINEAIEFKIAEDRQKKEITSEDLNKLEAFFKSASGQRMLNNSTIWIYRNHFNYKEIKQILKFYKTSAGQKMAADFPVIMLKSFMAAEMIKSMYAGGKLQ